MKKITLLIALALLTFACNNDDSDPQNFPSNTGSLTANVDNETTVFTGETVSTCFGDCVISDVNTLFNVNAEDSDGEFFGFFVINAEVGTFDLGNAESTDSDLACSSFAYYRSLAENQDDEDVLLTSYSDFGGSGSVTITKFDTNTNLASGSFEFVVSSGGINGEQITVTNGTFTDVAIQPLSNCTVAIF